MHSSYVDSFRTLKGGLTLKIRHREVKPGDTPQCLNEPYYSSMSVLNFFWVALFDGIGMQRRALLALPSTDGNCYHWCRSATYAWDTSRSTPVSVYNVPKTCYNQAADKVLQ